jgi:hypothetical protein
VRKHNPDGGHHYNRSRIKVIRTKKRNDVLAEKLWCCVPNDVKRAVELLKNSHITKITEWRSLASRIRRRNFTGDKFSFDTCLYREEHLSEFLDSVGHALGVLPLKE